MKWAKTCVVASESAGEYAIARALATAFRMATPYTMGSEMPLIFW